MSEELINASKERIAGFLEDINGGVGEDISYDEVFEQIKAETDKLSSVDGDACDWSVIESNAEQVLTEKSKDFRVACYLATCRLRNGTLEGVLDGYLLVKGVTEKYWETMYPPLRRIRARAGMLGWMAEQAAATVRDLKLKPSDATMTQLLDTTRREVEGMMGEKFGDHYPGMSALADSIRHLMRTQPKEEKKPEPKPEPKAAPQQPATVAASTPTPHAAATTASAGAGAAAGLGSFGNAADVRKHLEKTGKAIAKMGQLIRAEKPEDPLAYRMSRLGMWIYLEKVPPTNDGKSLVPPPPPHVRQGLETVAKSQDWLQLLTTADTAAGNFILWLDPHRHAAAALGALGALFMKAREELLLQVALHLQKVRGIEKLMFNDGTPFADAQTLSWIEQEVVPVLAQGDGGGGSTAGVLEEPLKEARGFAMKGELAKGIGVVAASAASLGSPVDRFKAKLAMAELCLGAGEAEIARAQFEGLAELVEVHSLTTWDPALCSSVYGGLYAATKAVNDAMRPKVVPTNPQSVAAAAAFELPPKRQAAESGAFELLCQLDPAAALKLGSAKK